MPAHHVTLLAVVTAPGALEALALLAVLTLLGPWLPPRRPPLLEDQRRPPPVDRAISLV